MERFGELSRFEVAGSRVEVASLGEVAKLRAGGRFGEAAKMGVNEPWSGE